MEYIGIIGSSHSTGMHYLDNGKVTKPFTDHCYKHSNNKTFINCAHGGKGSELFLKHIVYLKDRYDIKKIFIELIHDRSDLNANISKEDEYPKFEGKEYKKIQTIDNFNDLYNNTVEYPSMHYLQTFTVELSSDYIFSKQLSKKERHWREIKSLIASDYNMRDYWSMINIGLSLKLCSMLGIKTVVWSQKSHFEDLPLFEEIKKSANHIVKFGEEYNAVGYYSKKYKEQSIFCDQCHLTESIEEEMIKDFLLPALDKV